MMAGPLQRSMQTFRRSGSSGLVWDERFLTEEAGADGLRQQQQQPELRHSRSVGSAAAMLRRRCGGDGGGEADRDDKKRKLLVLTKANHKNHHHRKEEELLVRGTGGRKAFRARDVATADEPPSPRVPAGCCAPCAIFRDAASARGSSSLPRRAKKR